MKSDNDHSKPMTARPTPPKKPTEPVVRRIVNEKVINSREIALADR
jgi:hypothetical protein